MLEKIGNQKKGNSSKKKKKNKAVSSKNDTHLTFEIIQLN